MAWTLKGPELPRRIPKSCQATPPVPSSSPGRLPTSPHVCYLCGAGRLLPAGSSEAPWPSDGSLPGTGCQQFAVGFVCEFGQCARWHQEASSPAACPWQASISPLPMAPHLSLLPTPTVPAQRELAWTEPGQLPAAECGTLLSCCILNAHTYSRTRTCTHQAPTTTNNTHPFCQERPQPSTSRSGRRQRARLCRAARSPAHGLCLPLSNACLLRVPPEREGTHTCHTSEPPDWVPLSPACPWPLCPAPSLPCQLPGRASVVAAATPASLP